MAYANIQFTVLNATGSTPVAGAQLFVNGVNSNMVSDSNGRIQLPNFFVVGNTYSISVKATGMLPYSQSLTAAAANSVTISLVSGTTPATVTFTFNVSPDSENGQPFDGYDVTFDNNGSPVTVPYTTGGVQVQLTPGTQNVSGTAPGYDAISTSFNVGSDPTQGEVLNGTVNLVNSADEGTANQEATSDQTDPDTSTMLPTITQEKPPEFIAPNTLQGTYFTLTQARMYIGTMFIDELNGCQFALQDNKIPIYGYASRFYDSIAQGKSLVQGQLTINFVSEGYLYTVLQEYINTVATDVDSTNQQAQQNANRLLTLTNALQNPDPSWTPTMIANAKKEIQNLAASLGSSAVDAASAGINAQLRNQLDNVLGLAGGDYPNAVYQGIPFDIVLQFTGAGRTIIRRLEDVHLISNESILDPSGTPILDSYGFICRRLR